MSNSKLSAREFSMWEYMLKDLDSLNGMIFSFPDKGATVAIMEEFPGSRMMLVSISIADSSETKFKPKVGEYHALRRMFIDNEYLKIRTVFSEEYDPEIWARNFANTL